VLPGFLLAAVLFSQLVVPTPPAQGQDLAGRVPSDVTIRVVNGTTSEPGRAEKVELFSLAATWQEEEAAADVSGEVTFPGILVSAQGQYLVKVTADGVPYFGQVDGSQLSGQPLTVQVYSPTAELAGVHLGGLNVVVRQGEGTLTLEYMLTVENTGTPLRTVVPDPVSLRLALPPGAGDFQAQVMRGPEPFACEVTGPTGPGWVGLAVALPPGPTPLRLTAKVPYPGRLYLPVGANIPLNKWSILSFPADLEVRGNGLEPAPMAEETTFQRNRGPSLAANQVFSLEISGGAGPIIESVPETPAGEAAADTTSQVAESADDGWPVWPIPVLVLLAVLFLISRLLRSSPREK